MADWIADVIAGLVLLATIVLAFIAGQHWFRTETLTLMRWAAEQAMSVDDDAAIMGLDVLDALHKSRVLRKPDLAVFEAIYRSVLTGTK